MDKKKATICTILFAVIIVVLFVGAFFIDRGNINLGNTICCFITGWYIADWIKKFFNWLRK